MEPIHTIRLKPGEQDRLLAGHPWIYQNELEGWPPEAAPGDLVDLHDGHGRFLGRGYLNPRTTIAVRVLARDHEPVDREFFLTRIRQAVALREMMFYQPRNPKASDFYQCLAQHFDEFEASYDEIYHERYGFYRPVIRKVVKKFFLCGDLTQGFARVHCGQCHYEYLLAFSCKGRYFCPSCHQKRVLQFGEWVPAHVLPPITHRQYVFTIPKMLRVYFRTDRGLLGKLSQ